MAFNFNWSPLTADAEFYQRARELLTTALNKNPKPPIIVDDILVTEFNLGSVPPELEILEIGDIAEDRFRGIFKMCYSGDAFLTLKTRVQVCRIFFFVPYPTPRYPAGASLHANSRDEARVRSRRRNELANARITTSHSRVRDHSRSSHYRSAPDQFCVAIMIPYQCLECPRTPIGEPRLHPVMLPPPKTSSFHQP